MKPRTPKPSVREDRLEDARNRERVSAKIGTQIRDFFAANRGHQFNLDVLHDYVVAHVAASVAPGSVSRIMRSLRQRGVINYTLVSRRDSLYEVER